ncbi:CVNH domain-containing protein [Chaetomium tenue]|uniref:CVNH domain-containing protein n=1 Tax=Chaetomium tenue TaxID=1854479 RepID=A0ACB7P1M7_9PEZI|nr:CVNH domain-containing protein [Chaetomium globosum]
MRFLIFFASLASLLTTAAADSFTDFSRSCTGVDLFHNFFLSATCCHPDDNGADAQSENELDLTMCIGLDQRTGQMQWEVYGKFSNYCTNCTLGTAADGTEHQLTCACQALVGSRAFKQSTINLDEGIANEWGTLECAGGMATLPPGWRGD